MDRNVTGVKEKEFLLDLQVFGYSTKICIIVTYSLIMIVGVFLNSYILWVIFANKAVRTNRNIYIASLMVSDLLVCTFCIPFTLLVLLHPTWSYGIAPCKLLPFVQGTSIVVSTATIVAIGLERYRNVVNFSTNVSKSESGNALVGIFFVWFISCFPLLPFLVYQDVRTFSLPGHEDVQYEMCIEIWPQQYMKDLYSIFFIVIQLLLPAFTLWLINFKFKKFLNGQIVSGLSDRLIEKEKKRNRKVIRMLTAVAAVFAISWFPYHIDSLMDRFKPSLLVSQENAYLMFAVCHIVAMTSVASNPILYALLNSNLNKHMFQSLGHTLARKL